MIISFATVKITRSICDIFMKIPFDGSMMNCTQKNSGIGFALCLCKTNAKLAIKTERESNTVTKFREALSFYGVYE